MKLKFILKLLTILLIICIGVIIVLSIKDDNWVKAIFWLLLLFLAEVSGIILGKK